MKKVLIEVFLGTCQYDRWITPRDYKRRVPGSRCRRAYTSHFRCYGNKKYTKL